MEKDIYRIIEPPHLLTPYVRRLLIANCHDPVTFDSPAKPTGFNYIGWITRGEISAVYGEKSFVGGPNSFHISGQIYRIDPVLSFSGPVGHIIAECTALGLYQLTAICGQRAADDCRLIGELDSALGQQCLALQQEAATLSDQDLDTRLSLFQRWLIQLAQQPQSVPNYIQAAVDRIEQAHGVIKLSALTKALDISERQLNRKFTELVGVAPKFFARVLQMNRAFQALYENDTRYLTDIGYQAGYYDQAHFIRAMRTFFASSPKEYLHGEEGILYKFVAQSRDYGPVD